MSGARAIAGAVVSVEHAARAVPPELAQLFAGAQAVLAGHRGWDRGALELARELAADLGAPLLATEVTRLVVDANRSLDNPSLFSEYTRSLPEDQRALLVRRWWRPHREAVEVALEALLRVDASPAGPLLHLSVHSFTPRFEGRLRAVDVGLLYDPERPGERAFAERLARALRARSAELAVAHNEPYRGTDDGLTTFLRGRFAPETYLGIELEVSQRFPEGPRRAWDGVRELVRSAVGEAVAG